MSRVFKQVLRNPHDRKKFKICYVLAEFNPDTDTHLYAIYEMLERLGKEVNLYLFFERSVGQPQFQNIQRIYCQRFTCIPINLLERFIVFVFIRLLGYDRFYVHYSVFSVLLTALVTRFSRGKTFFWHCGHKSWFENPWQFDIKIILEKLTSDIPFRIVLKWVNYLVTGTPTMKSYYATEFHVDPEKILVMPNWVNLERFSLVNPDLTQLRQRLGIPVDRKLILFVHRLVERKGAHYIVPVAENVIKVHDALIFVIGDGPYRAGLVREIATSRYRDHFKLIGVVPNHSLPDYLAAADVLMMPSEEEGFPRILIEAMASGLPFVAYDVGGVRDIVTPLQARFVVPRGDVQSFSQGLIDLLKDYLLNQEFAEEGLRQVQHYLLERVSERFVDIISS